MPLAVEDAREDPRTRGHLAIGALGVIAYLAVPLALPGGCVIGSLCVVDVAPRPWSAEDVQAITDLSGAVMAEFAAGLQLRELNAASEALHKSEAFLRSMFEASADCIKVIERDGTLSFLNGRGQCAMEIDDFSGVDGVEWAMLWPPGARDQVRAAVAAGLAGTPSRFEGFCPTAKGTPRWWDVSLAPIAGLHGGPSRLIAISRDITERKRTEAVLNESEDRQRELQAELLHVSRLSAAGEMASALAHELNQPLTAIASAVKAAQRMLTASHTDAAAELDLREAMDLTAEQALRAGQIIRRLREFVTRGGEVEKRMEDLAKLAEDAGALALLGARERSVRVTFHFAPRLPRVLVDRIQIQQVILNLIRNALDAMASDKDGMPRERTLVLEAHPRRVRHDRGQHRRHWARPCGGGRGLPVRPVRLHQEGRHGHGPGHLPLDHRGAWRAALGRTQSWARHRVPLHAPDGWAGWDARWGARWDARWDDGEGRCRSRRTAGGRRSTSLTMMRPFAGPWRCCSVLRPLAPRPIRPAWPCSMPCPPSSGAVGIAS